MKNIIAILILSILTGGTYAQTVPSYVSTSGLVGWWSFTGNAIDSSGNGNNGTVNGATLTNDRFGHANSAYSFNGSSNNINPLQNNLPFNRHKRTVSVWFQIIGTGGCVFSYGSPSTNNAYMVTVGSSIISNQSWSSGTDDYAVYPTIDANWHNLVTTFDSINASIYLDGVSLGSSMRINWNTLPSTFYFGTRVTNDLDFFSGKMDDIGIWNRVLTPCEIQKLYLASVTSPLTNPSNDTVLSAAVATFSVTDTFTSATYQWQQNAGSGFSNLSNAGPYSGVTTKTLTINPVTTSMNNYLYRCIRNSGSGSCLIDTTSSALLVINTTAVNSITQNSKISIAPNPANNNIVVESDATINKIEITNIIGQKLLSQVYKSNNVTVDLSSFTNGVYFIKVNDSYFQKLIKQ
jgi:hypothetical protein